MDRSGASKSAENLGVARPKVCPPTEVQTCKERMAILYVADVAFMRCCIVCKEKVFAKPKR
jgi:hypothetical protein